MENGRQDTEIVSKMPGITIMPRCSWIGEIVASAAARLRSQWTGWHHEWGI
jgi:hypothetical protein